MIQMLEFLTGRVLAAVKHINMQLLYEIRLRADKPVLVNYGGEYRFLGAYGLVDRTESAILVTASEIADTVFAAGRFSVYSVEEQIKRGFITAENGERIGLAGQFVYDKGTALAVRDFTSVCIRVPHEVVGCGAEIYEKCLSDELKNTLIASPPGIGKTTLLRDLCRIISEKTARNILVCDERGELSAGNTGETSDVLMFADKATAFDVGIRTMRPDVIVTDELSDGDCVAVKRAIVGGVKVLASAHFESVKEIKPPFSGLFERYVFLDRYKIGKIAGIYDENLRVLAV